jgi:hypothetical protein
MKNHFIPIDNKIDKAIAFAQSLDNQSFRTRNRIKQPSTYINTLSIVQNLQHQGWEIAGVCEQRGKDRKIASNYVKMEHPDFKMMNKNKVEGISCIYISNSCDGKRPLNLDFGMYRLVCSNGLIQRTPYIEHTIRHTQQGIEQIPVIMQSVNSAAQRVLGRFDSLKTKELKPDQLEELVNKAARLRFNDDVMDASQLLNIYRDEDKGNDLWSVYNRIQENLIKSSMLIDRNGRPLAGVNDVKSDIVLNQALFGLIENYA